MEQSTMAQPEALAYRALIDSQRYAIIHANDLLEAGRILHEEYPDRTLVAQRLQWWDGRRPAGSMVVHERLYPLVSGHLPRAS